MRCHSACEMLKVSRRMAAFACRRCEFDAAAEALAEAETLNPESALMLSAKATLLMVSGHFDEAQSY